jgi:branched-chain amino acid aminotransferase
MPYPFVFLDGEYVTADQARISIFDRGFLLGDGVFETGRLHLGRYFRLEQHFRRLEQSGSVLGLPIPTLSQLIDIAEQLAERNGFQEGSLRITVTRGAGGRGLSRAGVGSPTIVATLLRIPEDWESRAAKGWRVKTASARRPATTSVPAQLKALGRTYALLAYFEAEDSGFDDALLLSAEDLVAEGPTWNLFWRIGKTVFTAALSAGVLEGVTRSIIMDLLRAAGYDTKEGLFPRQALDQAEEVFATMTSSGVVPITQLDDRVLPKPTVVPRLQSDYWQLVRSELGQKE